MKQNFEVHKKNMLNERNLLKKKNKLLSYKTENMETSCTNQNLITAMSPEKPKKMKEV